MTPLLARSIPKPPAPKMELPRMRLPVAGSLTPRPMTIAANLVFAMMLPAPAVVPPIVFPEAPLLTTTP